MVKVKSTPSEAQKNLDKALKTLAGKVGKVGWFEKSKYPTKTAPPVAYIASIHEFGYAKGNIPARPFMRPTILAKKTEWAMYAEKGARSVLRGKRTASAVMELLTINAAADVQKTLSLLREPPLQPATIERRRAKKTDKKTIGLLDKPLIDTGLLFGTLIGKVEKE
jgi:hypothetical protein